MSQKVVYHWFEEIVEHMPLKKWQGLNLASLSMGVVLARSSLLTVVAEHLGMMGSADSMERRLQRFISNSRVDIEACCTAWVKWVMMSLSEGAIILLVDETKLGNHLSVMMVGLAYRGRCIPLAWCSYAPDAWPMSQVDLIEHLLKLVAAGLPAGMIPLLQADRGIGTSPELVRRVEALGWQYLFRVQGHTAFRSLQGYASPLDHLVNPGKSCYQPGFVFRDAGWLPTHVHIIWRKRFAQPWCLITNAPTLAGITYALRAWQEQAFRDLKRGGWHWNQSRVWEPPHADRLLLALTLAYAWMLSLGTAVIRSGHRARLVLSRGSQWRFSVFRLGLRRFFALLFSARPIPVSLCFVPHPPLAKSVV